MASGEAGHQTMAGVAQTKDAEDATIRRQQLGVQRLSVERHPAAVHDDFVGVAGDGDEVFHAASPGGAPVCVSTAMASTWAVWGNRSKASTDFNSNPLANLATSRASVAGSQLT